MFRKQNFDDLDEISRAFNCGCFQEEGDVLKKLEADGVQYQVCSCREHAPIKCMHTYAHLHICELASTHSAHKAGT